MPSTHEIQASTDAYVIHTYLFYRDRVCFGNVGRQAIEDRAVCRQYADEVCRRDLAYASDARTRGLSIVCADPALVALRAAAVAA